MSWQHCKVGASQPIYKWGNWGLWKLGIVTQITQPESGCEDSNPALTHKRCSKPLHCNTEPRTGGCTFSNTHIRAHATEPEPCPLAVTSSTLCRWWLRRPRQCLQKGTIQKGFKNRQRPWGREHAQFVIQSRTLNRCLTVCFWGWKRIPQAMETAD